MATYKLTKERRVALEYAKSRALGALELRKEYCILQNKMKMALNYPTTKKVSVSSRYDSIFNATDLWCHELHAQMIAQGAIIDEEEEDVV